MWYMVIVLLFGVLFMIYGLVIGEMSVNMIMEWIVWLIIGFMILGVMVFFGCYFYVGVWNLFKNYLVNMDILIVLGIGIVWLYLMIVVFFSGYVFEMVWYVYFEVIVMIIGLINLGLVFEIKVCGKILEVIKRLIGL